MICGCVRLHRRVHSGYSGGGGSALAPIGMMTTFPACSILTARPMIGGCLKTDVNRGLESTSWYPVSRIAASSTQRFRTYIRIAVGSIPERGAWSAGFSIETWRPRPQGMNPLNLLKSTGSMKAQPMMILLLKCCLKRRHPGSSIPVRVMKGAFALPASVLCMSGMSGRMHISVLPGQDHLNPKSNVRTPL